MQKWVGRETTTSFARSRVMDLNDFLICKNALNIRFSRDIVAQSHEDLLEQINTAPKVSKYGVSPGPYIPEFGLNTGKYGPEKSSVFGSFHAVK